MRKILLFIGKLFLRFSIYFTISVCVFFVSYHFQHHIFFLNILFDYVDITLLPFIVSLIAVGSFLIAFCVELVCSGNFLSNLKYFWRIGVLCLIDIFIFAIIALVFKWFPIGNLKALGSFFLFVMIINLIWGGSLILKTKLQDRKDNKMLEKYKRKLKNGEYSLPVK